jgi:hypothetical protein
MRAARSPLGFPERIGAAIRCVVSTLLVILDVFMFAVTVQGIQHGSLMWPSQYIKREIFRARQPTLFWIVAVLYLGICGWLFYASIAEIMYVLRRSKRH